MKNVVKQVEDALNEHYEDMASEFLNSESESTLGQASDDSIADTKVIEKPQGSGASFSLST